MSEESLIVLTDAKPEEAPLEQVEIDAIDLIATAIRSHRKRLSLFPMDGLLMDAARKNDKRPAYLQVATVDSVVMNIRGEEKFRDAYIIVRIPRDVVDEITHPSLIVQPGITLV